GMVVGQVIRVPRAEGISVRVGQSAGPVPDIAAHTLWVCVLVAAAGLLLVGALGAGREVVRGRGLGAGVAGGGGCGGVRGGVVAGGGGGGGVGGWGRGVLGVVVGEVLWGGRGEGWPVGLGGRAGGVMSAAGPWSVRAGIVAGAGLSV